MPETGRPDPPAAVKARAPGRLDVMGGIADYSGSLVLQLPLAVATRASVELRSTNRYDVTSSGGESAPPRSLTMDVDEAAEVLSTYEHARTYFHARPEDHWASYVLGCLTALLIEEEVPLPAGLSIRIDSDVPEGKGVSSSAALEVCMMAALARVLDVHLSTERIAHLCQRVENRVAGAPCGIMDQMTAACGRKDHLLALLCQPAKLEGQVRVPNGINIWGIDSGIRHSVGGADYGTVRTAAAMGYRIVAEIEGLPVEETGPGRVVISDARYGGYLANLGPSRLSRILPSLPERMPGSQFLARFGGIADSTVTVRGETIYPVRAATAHPVSEYDRNVRFASLLSDPNPTPKTLAMMGELMYLSHAGYSACGLGSEGTDRIVELVKDAGYHEGLFGARVTGGGSGGTVAVLAASSSADTVRSIARAYAKEAAVPETVFQGSSNGVSVKTINSAF